jgi:hypothetical protein
VDKKQEAPKPNLGTESKTSIKIQPVSNKGKMNLHYIFITCW